MNILITGASGFIGGLLLETLKGKNYNIVGTVLTGRANSDDCKVIRIDLSNKSEASNFFYENRIIFAAGMGFTSQNSIKQKAQFEKYKGCK